MTVFQLDSKQKPFCLPLKQYESMTKHDIPRIHKYKHNVYVFILYNTRLYSINRIAISDSGSGLLAYTHGHTLLHKRKYRNTEMIRMMKSAQKPLSKSKRQKRRKIYEIIAFEFGQIFT